MAWAAPPRQRQQVAVRSEGAGETLQELGVADSPKLRRIGQLHAMALGQVGVRGLLRFGIRFNRSFESWAAVGGGAPTGFAPLRRARSIATRPWC